MKTKKVKAIRGGQVRIFDSAAEAARIVGGFATNITASIRGRVKSYRGYRWEYVREHRFKAHPDTDCMPIPAIFRKGMNFD